MSDITLIGINHKTASVELREALAFTDEEIPRALMELKRSGHAKEVLIFSTCNRMEILFIPGHQNGVEAIMDFLVQTKKIPGEKFKQALYTHKNHQAVKHLFRVASSLDSMIVGEPQILGQVKSAYRKTVECRSSGVILNRLMHKAFSIAKKVRRETGIGDSAVSISYAAIELANKIFSDLNQRSVMLLGAGEMAELAIEHLISHGVTQIFVANRTFKNAVKLAEKFNGVAISFEERIDLLARVDIIVSSTGATDYILTATHVGKALKLRRYRPLFFIDIAVPRDIDPAINKMDNAYLYDIDDLQEIVSDNMDERKKEAMKGERLVEEAVIKFQEWLDNLDLVPTIVAIRNKIETITEMEAYKTLHTLNLKTEEEDAIKRMLQSITSKIMHDPIRFLKDTGCHRNDSFYISAARHIFNLDPLNGEDAH
ncbi:MAG: glutamyl-tRNA reductase [Desulfamplus sp.]|nr:glutamyl-tRNA reductase [Desulfamplus sp.]